MMSRLKTTDNSRMYKMIKLKVPVSLEYFKFWVY